MKADTKKKKLKPYLMIVGGAILVILMAFIVYRYTHSTAADIGNPIDKLLTSGGAKKVCGSTSPGNGPDSKVSGYIAYYETSLDRQQVVSLITNSANQNGFSLKHAESGSLPIPDVYVGNYYFDNTTRISSLPWAETGPVSLTFAIGNFADKDVDTSYAVSNPPCDAPNGTLRVNNDAEHVAIEMQILMPANKW